MVEIIKTSSFVENFGSAIRSVRKEKHLSLAQLSQLAGTSLSNISKIETSQSKGISLALLERLAEALDKPLYKLVATAEGVSISSAEVLAPEERQLIEDYRAANNSAKRVIKTVAKVFSSQKQPSRKKKPSN